MSRKASTDARGSGERRFFQKPPGWLRVMESNDRMAPIVTSASRLTRVARAAAMRSRTSSRNRGSEVYCPMP
jgi:hypothetical protein